MEGTHWYQVMRFKQLKLKRSFALALRSFGPPQHKK